jgi:hypothetical protein
MFTPEQVTALTAQAANAATYNAYDADGNLLPDWQLNDSGVPVYLGNEIATRGIGIYGQTPAGLILTGYLKPGTINLITAPELTLTVLNNPAVWTGNQGVTSLLEYLNEPILQNLAQIKIMEGAYQGLINAGVIVGNESARYQATFLQPATRYGVDSIVSWIQGIVSNTLVSKIVQSARQGQYAIDFVDSFESLLNSGVNLPGFSNTVDRQELDQAVVDIIGNQKVAAIDYADEIAVTIPAITDEEGVFRFAPGKPKA